MKKVLTLSIILLFTGSIYAQLYKVSFDPVIRTSNGDVLELALAGGLNQPQFSNFDFDNDGIEDLFVYDRTGDKVLVFINETDENGLSYRYDPSYEDFFPKAKEYMHLKDYNDDEKADLWMYNGDSVVLYQNYTTSIPDFRRVRNLEALDQVNYVEWNPFKRISHVTGCIPGIEDLDNDGDIDIVTNLNSAGSAMILFCNNTVDSGHALEDITYMIPDKCYGGIDEFSGYLITNAPCLFREAYDLKEKKHFATKTMLFFDQDNDGDYDLFYGSSERSSNPIYYFKNAKVELDHYKDTFVMMDTAYFSSSVEPLIPVAPAMSYVDVDGDGEKDLILSTNEATKTSYPIMEKNNVLYFDNKESTTDPDFDFKSNNFLVGDMVDFGGYTAPAFVDLDGDNDFDLILATSGNHYVTGDSNDFLVYYENIGSKTNPDYKLIDENYLNLIPKKYQKLVPTFADIDNDGLMDLFLGKQDGTIAYYRNNGSSSSPSFQLMTENFKTIDVGDNATPVFYDLNGDGVLDLLSGNYGGNIQYYKNTGSVTAPSFNLEDDSLGGIQINELIKQQFLGPNGFYDSFVYQYWGYSSLAVARFNDSIQYLCVGGDEGKVRLFRINDTLTAKFEESENYMHMAFTDDEYVKDWGTRVYPAAADINNDGVTDLLIGNARGGINYLEGNDTSTIAVVNAKMPEFFMAPNPSNGSIKVYTQSNESHWYQLVDLSGRVVQKGQTYNGLSIQINPTVANGVYFVQLRNKQVAYTPQKLILFK
jgi:hypothetical protein